MYEEVQVTGRTTGIGPLYVNIYGPDGRPVLPFISFPIVPNFDDRTFSLPISVALSPYFNPPAHNRFGFDVPPVQTYGKYTVQLVQDDDERRLHVTPINPAIGFLMPRQIYDRPMNVTVTGSITGTEGLLSIFYHPPLTTIYPIIGTFLIVQIGQID